MKEIDEKWLEKLDAITQEKMSDPGFSLIDLVNELSISPAQLYRKVLKLKGKSPKSYIREKRLNYAKELLERGVYPTVVEVALAVGYLHPNTFSIDYEKKFGVRPNTYFKEK